MVKELNLEQTDSLTSFGCCAPCLTSKPQWFSVHSRNQGVEEEECLRDSYLACLFSFCKQWSPGAQELSSLSFVLCWALGPQSSPWGGQSLSDRVSEPKDDVQTGSQALERLPFQPHHGLGLVPPHAHGHCPSPAHSIPPQVTTEASLQASKGPASLSFL